MDRREFLKAIGATGAVLLSPTCMNATQAKSGREAWRTRITDHFDGERFFNPGLKDDKGFWDLVKWQLNRDGPKWPEKKEDNHPFTHIPTSEQEPLRVTRINHCSFLIQIGPYNLLTDPIYSERTSPVSWAGPKRIRPPGIAWESLPKIDLVLVSHNHFDHLDLPTLRKLHGQFSPQFITGLGNAGFLAEEDVPGATELDWWERHEAVNGLSVTYTPAQHWSNRGGGTRNKSLWGGFFIQWRDKSVYFAGDSGYCSWFAEIRKRLGPPTVALLPIGAYKPNWFMKTNHMGPAEAAQAHLDLGAMWSVPMHHDTFRLADEGYDEPLADLAAALQANRTDVSRFPFTFPGETLTPRLTA